MIHHRAAEGTEEDRWWWHGRTAYLRGGRAHLRSRFSIVAELLPAAVFREAEELSRHAEKQAFGPEIPSRLAENKAILAEKRSRLPEDEALGPETESREAETEAKVALTQAQEDGALGAR